MNSLGLSKEARLAVGRRARGQNTLRLLRNALRTPRGATGATLVAIVVLIAALGPLLASGSPTGSPGLPFENPTEGAIFGYDELGRDVLTRVLHGGWTLLLLAAAATIVGVGAGTIVGVAAAYFKGLSDGVLMRTADIVLAFPQLVLALLLVSVAGPSVTLIVFAVALAHTPQVARVVRAAALDVCERDYVKAIELFRISSWRVIFGEVVPGVVSVIMVELGLRLTYSILVIAALSFLGFGLQPPDPNWGLMVNENRIGLSQNPWALVVPAGLIAVLTIGMNTFTDAVARVLLGVDEIAATRAGMTTPTPEPK